MGETKPTLNIRAQEHVTASILQVKGEDAEEHCWRCNQDFDWEHKKVHNFEKKLKTRTIKDAVYSEENWHHINGIPFKLPNMWKPILRESKVKQRKQPPKLQHHRTESIKVCQQVWLHRSATKVNQLKTTLKYFDPLRTHKYLTHTHLT